MCFLRGFCYSSSYLFCAVDNPVSYPHVTWNVLTLPFTPHPHIGILLSPFHVCTITFIRIRPLTVPQLPAPFYHTGLLGSQSKWQYSPSYPEGMRWESNTTLGFSSSLKVSGVLLALLEKSNSEFLLSLSPLQINSANCFPKAFFHPLILHSQPKLPISPFTKKNRYNPVKMTNFTCLHPHIHTFTIFTFYPPHFF